MKLFKPCLILLALITLNCSFALAQHTRSVSVKNFKGLSVSSGIDLFLTQGNTEGVSIQGSSDAIKDVIVEQNGDHVSVKYKSGINWSSLFRGQSIEVHVSYKTLERLAASGGSDVYSKGQMKVQSLSINASGGADLKLNIICRDLSLNISGGADADLRGSAENLQISASGGSDINAFDFPANYAKVAVSGGSDANIYVNKILDGQASGGGDINYKGKATLKKANTSKSGDINHVR
ncbi:MAG: DUF2807 domain-containing protein [Pedobacter sp.]|nr:MAG: DUF2807 domain-containing protein [Pedobacter sp.]